MKTITFVGNIGKVEDLRPVGQHTVLNFSVAVNKRDKEAQPDWIRCAVWDKRATTLAQYLAKGKKVCVIGEHSIRTYEKDGRDCYSEECRVSEIEFFDVARRGGNNSSGGHNPTGGGGGYDDADYGGGEHDDIPF